MASTSLEVVRSNDEASGLRSHHELLKCSFNWKPLAFPVGFSNYLEKLVSMQHNKCYVPAVTNACEGGPDSNAKLGLTPTT